MNSILRMEKSCFYCDGEGRTEDGKNCFSCDGKGLEKDQDINKTICDKCFGYGSDDGVVSCPKCKGLGWYYKSSSDENELERKYKQSSKYIVTFGNELLAINFDSIELTQNTILYFEAGQYEIVHCISKIHKKTFKAIKINFKEGTKFYLCLGDCNKRQGITLQSYKLLNDISENDLKLKAGEIIVFAIPQ